MKKTIIIALATVSVAGCALNSNPIVEQCAMSVKHGNVISNELMLSMYPHTYKVGTPQYIERDYEAGANFICATIKHEYGRDLCAEEKVHWY